MSDSMRESDIATVVDMTIAEMERLFDEMIKSWIDRVMQEWVFRD